MIQLIVRELTENGVTEPSRLFESPFTNVSATGPMAVFPAATVQRIIAVLGDIKQKAAG
ncbi:hypothetical protein QCL97_002420 [Chromobacterium amazonense]|uniref:EcoEI R protein C-terminal domain-containing protein n=1 Tax=Chromobacterium amazonense TaxID=1382803 RepID=A0ABU8UY59_9NEIS|nr:hypothetical protein [Chromobacterium amazonense]MDQ4539963.1 hypothetical protein [Chromobacterium amazonense]